jgi:hypothetical protein
MPYINTAISHSNNYTLNATAATGSCACTIMWIKSNGATSCEVLTNHNGARSVPGGAVRMVFFVSISAGCTGIFQVTQSGSTFADLVLGGSAPIDLMVQFPVS